MVALGSSFAAGPLLRPVADRPAMRSMRNYPRLLAGRLGCELVDLTVSGATTKTVIDVPQVTMTGEQYPPQLAGMPPDADLVTITVGGNDIGFIGAMMYHAWRRHDAKSLVLQGIEPPGALEDPIGRVAEGLGRVVRAVREHAPGARIVLVDYLTVLDDDRGSAEIDYSATELALFRQRQTQLAAGFRRAADDEAVDLMPISAASSGHGLGSAEPFVFDFIPDPLRTTGSFHPNERGMAFVADQLADRLSGDRLP
ncbi:SGNH/GDSL hydrolase family protein [Nakamurella sp. DB0629]|uniref:SGNH/GDSL hydrolase family protein n=2 Tax=Nakamurella aerolata TaxID=1656892 RepID=A0A849AA90_9ACTN|nr:SGNH/GDSL hydrolase family protein [Nakamurella aerolata]NNG36877.1 SGNH/GDSL hydrolase family protein [Nakamurella aerolata]